MTVVPTPKLILVAMMAALCETVCAQVIDPAQPRYLEPVYLRLGPNPYVKWFTAQVSMEGATIAVRIQRLRCNDLCSPSPVSDVALGRFPTGSYKVLVIFNDNDVSAQEFTVAGPQDASIIVDYSGMWWSPSEAGWGMSVFQGATGQVFAVWFVYDESGRPTWYTLQGALGGSPSRVSGSIFRTAGPYFGDPFNPSDVTYATVGNGSISFASSNVAVLQYVVDGVSGTKQLTRQVIE